MTNHFLKFIIHFLKVWSKRWAVLRSTSHDGVVRLEYYDKEENEIKGENRRVIILRNSTGCCETSDYKRSKPHAFQFSSSIGTQNSKTATLYLHIYIYILIYPNIINTQLYVFLSVFICFVCRSSCLFN